ncbi:MAG: hypothetical protein KDB65_09885 [Calditrichaeota bacterium]|nr:hypothetical protein [Calditrichota bacterium]MCB9369502.1 hypothetical protein [Calditrichota bacterium]
MRLVVVFAISLFIFGCQSGKQARELMKQHRAEAVPMTGMMSYMADAASFVECGTGDRYAVKFKGDWLEVERAYVNMRQNGEPVYVEFFGRTEDDSTDGNVRAGVVIEEITEMKPDTVCQK